MALYKKKIIRRKQKNALLFLYLLILTATYSFLQNRRVRRFGVRPLNKLRKIHGHFRTLFNCIKKQDNEQFFKYTRMTIPQFNKLLGFVEKRLEKSKKKAHLSAEERLAIIVHFLAEGCSQQQLAWDYLIGKSTVHNIVVETCEAIWDILQPIYLKAPSTPQEWDKIADAFYKRWNVPNCIGAIDGKHIAIQAPKHTGSMFFNYKKHFSIVLMAACDSYYRFTMVDIGGAGSNNDGQVFSSSWFGQALLHNLFNFPVPKKLPNSSFVTNYFFVGDVAFPLHQNIMRPYPGDFLEEKKRIFNYRISRARRTIENTFGIMVQRWRLLRKTIIADLENCEKFVKAIVILHNYLQKTEEQIPENERRYCPTGYGDYVDKAGVFHYGKWRSESIVLKGVGRVGSNNFGSKVKQQREILNDWFTSVGSLPWQEEKVYEGAVPDSFKN